MNEVSPFVTASEISEYLYCKRGWWLRFNNKLTETESMIQGTRKHNAIFKELLGHDRVTFVLQLLLLIAMILIGGYLLFLLVRS